MSKKGSAPQSPQPYNATSPFGSTTFTAPANGKSGQETISFSPQTQKYLNQGLKAYTANTKAADAAAGQLPTQPFSAAGLPYNPSSISMPQPGDFQNQANQAAQASFAEEKGMLQPGFDQAQNQLNTSLSDRGIPLGSEIDANEKNLLASQQNNALQQAAQGAVLAGNQEQQSLFNEANTGANTELGINSQAMQQALTQRELPFNEESAYLSGQPVTFGATPQYQNIQPLQIAGYQGQLQQYNQGQSALSNGLFGLGSAALSAFAPSKRDYKKDITKIGKFDKGLNIYSYRYKGEDDDAPVRVGVMADEVKGFSPWAVHDDMPDGVTRVDYGAVVEAMQ